MGGVPDTQLVRFEFKLFYNYVKKNPQIQLRSAGFLFITFKRRLFDFVFFVKYVLTNNWIIFHK